MLPLPQPVTPPTDLQTLQTIVDMFVAHSAHQAEHCAQSQAAFLSALKENQSEIAARLGQIADALEGLRKRVEEMERLYHARASQEPKRVE